MGVVQSLAGLCCCIQLAFQQWLLQANMFNPKADKAQRGLICQKAADHSVGFQLHYIDADATPAGHG